MNAIRIAATDVCVRAPLAVLSSSRMFRVLWGITVFLCGAASALGQQALPITSSRLSAAEITPVRRDLAVIDDNVDGDRDLRWPRGEIPYEIDEDIERDPQIVAAIEAAIREWETNTAIRFVEPAVISPNLPTLRFEPFPGRPCSAICAAQVGAFKPSGSSLFESVFGVWDRDRKVLISGLCGVSSLVHEIGHAVGLLHEHQRADRDKFVRLHPSVFESLRALSADDDDRENGCVSLEIESWRNSFEQNFESRYRPFSDTPYDYSSVMHYRNLFLTVPPGIPVRRGSGLGGLSAGDIHGVRRYYADLAPLRPLDESTTITTNPPGLDIVVNGERFSTPYRSKWTSGVRYTVETPAVQFQGLNRYLFGNWGGSGNPVPGETAATIEVTAGEGSRWLQANFVEQPWLPSQNRYDSSWVQPAPLDTEAGGESRCSITGQNRCWIREWYADWARDPAHSAGIAAWPQAFGFVSTAGDAPRSQRLWLTNLHPQAATVSTTATGAVSLLRVKRRDGPTEESQNGSQHRDLRMDPEETIEIELTARHTGLVSGLYDGAVSVTARYPSSSEEHTITIPVRFVATAREDDAGPIIATVAGSTGDYAYGGDGGPALEARFNGLAGIAIDALGNLYIADSGNHRVRRVTPAGIIDTVAGTGEQGYGGDAGPAREARLDQPGDVAVDALGNLYIADRFNSRVRRVTPAGIIDTVAGTGEQGYGGDAGPAAEARLWIPSGVAVDALGNLYIADTFNNRVRRVTPAGIIDTVAGTGEQGYGGDAGPATEARLDRPEDVAVDALGNLYIADSFNNRVRRVTPDGIIDTVAGTGTWAYGGDAGPAAGAHLSLPSGVAVDALGNLYIADSFNNRVRRVTLAGVIDTVAGTGEQGYGGDAGPAAEARLDSPSSVAVDALGNLYTADSSNNRVRWVGPSTNLTLPQSTPSAVTDSTGVGAETSTTLISSPDLSSVPNLGNAEARRPFEEEAAALTARLQGETVRAREGRAEYHRLVNELQSLFAEDPVVGALAGIALDIDPLSRGVSGGSYDRETVARAAAGLASYLRDADARSSYAAAAEALAAAAAEGTQSAAQAERWGREYSRVVRELKKVFAADPVVGALRPFYWRHYIFGIRGPREPERNFNSGTVVRAATALATYLRNADARGSYAASAEALAAAASEGTDFYYTIEEWAREYDRLLLELKSIFAEDPVLEALEALTRPGFGPGGNYDDGTVAQAAAALAAYLRSGEYTPPLRFPLGRLASSLDALAARASRGTDNYLLAVEWWYDYLALLADVWREYPSDPYISQLAGTAQGVEVGPALAAVDARAGQFLAGTVARSASSLAVFVKAEGDVRLAVAMHAAELARAVDGIEIRAGDLYGALAASVFVSEYNYILEGVRVALPNDSDVQRLRSLSLPSYSEQILSPNGAAILANVEDAATMLDDVLAPL